MWCKKQKQKTFQLNKRLNKVASMNFQKFGQVRALRTVASRGNHCTVYFAVRM